MDKLDQLEALIEAELQMYGTNQDGRTMTDMSEMETQQYAINKENLKENLSRIQLLQEIKTWIGHIREEMRFSKNVALDGDPLSRLETRILENMSEDDLVTAEILQRVNTWISEIRYKNF